MNYKINSRFINFCFKSFCAVSILLFSFAPFLALESTLTQVISKLLYALWFVGLVAICCFGEFSKRKLKRCLFIFLLILIFSVIGILSVGLVAFASQFSNLIIPIIVAVLFYSISNLSLKKKDLSVLFCIFLACVFLNCIFAIYTVFSFNGNFNTLYISKAEYQPYNYLRQGKLRAFGFLNSAVIFSNYLSIIVIYLFFFLKKKKFFISRILFFVLVVFSLLLSGCRTNLFAIFVALFLLLFFNKHRKLVFVSSILSIGFILLFITFSSGLDLSALGRIKQYTDAAMFFIKNPLGYGIGYASFPAGVISFDCAILVILVNFGTIGFVYLLHFIYRCVKNPRNKKDKFVFVCDSLVLVLLLLSGFVNVIHLGFLTLLVITYKLCELRRNSQ